MKDKSIDSILLKIWNEKITTQMKATFISVVIFGLFAHLYMFTNKLPNYDDLTGINGFGTTFRTGRWFLWVLGSTEYHLNLLFSLPFFNGLVTVLFIAVSSVIIVQIIDLKGIMDCVLAGALLVVFPSWTGTFFFMYTSVNYSIAVLMAVVGVFIIKKDCKYWWISVILMTLSTSVYQANLTVIVTLLVLRLVYMTYEKISFKVIFIRCFQYLFLLVGTIITYLGSVKISLWITNQQLSDDKGINSMGQNIGELIIPAFVTSCRNMINLIINNHLEISYNIAIRITFLVVFSIDIILGIVHIVFLWREKQWKKALLFITLSLISILAVNSIYFMGVKNDGIYVLMLYSFVFLLINPLALFEKTYSLWGEKIIQRWILFMESLVIFLLGTTVICYCSFANGQYLSMDLSLKQAESYYNTLTTQIKSIEGYRDDMTVLYVGSTIQDDSFYDNSIMDTFDIRGRHHTLLNEYSRLSFLKYYCGFNQKYVECTKNEYTNEIANMPRYPIDGSIEVIGDQIVVKFENMD